MGYGNNPAGPLQHENRSSILDYLARRYSRLLNNFFQRRGANPDDVPDLVQDVFLRLSRLSKIPDLNRFEPYLFRTATSALRDRVRRDVVRERAAHFPFDETLHGCSPFTPEQIVGDQSAVNALMTAITDLPERSRDVFVLRFYEEMSCASIAEAMGISKRAVEKHYARALARVTLRLKDYRDV